MNFRILLITLAMSALLPGEGVARGEGHPRTQAIESLLRMTASAEKVDYRPNESVTIRVEVTNLSPETLYLPYGVRGSVKAGLEDVRGFGRLPRIVTGCLPPPPSAEDYKPLNAGETIELVVSHPLSWYEPLERGWYRIPLFLRSWTPRRWIREYGPKDLRIVCSEDGSLSVDTVWVRVTE